MKCESALVQFIGNQKGLEIFTYEYYTKSNPRKIKFQTIQIDLSDKLDV